MFIAYAKILILKSIADYILKAIVNLIWEMVIYRVKKQVFIDIELILEKNRYINYLEVLYSYFIIHIWLIPQRD